MCLNEYCIVLINVGNYSFCDRFMILGISCIVVWVVENNIIYNSLKVCEFFCNIVGCLCEDICIWVWSGEDISEFVVVVVCVCWWYIKY